MQRTVIALALLTLAGATFAQQPELPLIFHAPLDGSLEATAAGSGTPALVEGPVEYRPGKAGQALLVGDGAATLHYETAGNLGSVAGTISMWVCPLDWTGETDTFHVFLEANSPRGWLVFYRYYQGGILTLLGLPNSFRSAASPPIRWNTGEWHHIAGTWRPSGLAVYIDGKLQASAPYPIMPEEWPERFRLGDHPWHVERDEQSLIDDVKIFSVPLSDEEIAAIAADEPFEYEPQIAAKLVVDPDTDTMVATVDAIGLLGDPQGRVATLELADEAGTAVASGETREFDRGIVRITTPVGALAEGLYQARIAVAGPDGAELASVTEPFRKPGPPVWSGNDLGVSDEVLKPWTPLAVDGTSVACWGRDYRFGGLIAEATTQGLPLLAEPMRLEAVIDGATVVLDGASSLDASSEAKAQLSGELSGGGLSASVQHEAEFDGFTWTDLTITPDGERTVDELRLTWAMPAAQATLLHCDQMRWTQNVMGELPEEGWSSKWTHMFWLGNEIGGLCWYTESDQHWVAAEERPALEVTRDGDLARVTVRLIAQPTAIDAPISYGFGVMATPARPFPDNARALRMSPAPRATFEILWPNTWFSYYGYTEPKDPEQLADHMESAHAAGVKVVPYINLNYTSAGIPEWQYYGSRWANGRAVTPSDVAQMGYASMGTSPAVRDWQDFILYRINEMIDVYGVDGIYIDCWSPYDSTVGTAGWTDDTGNMHPTRPIRAYREILRRVYTLFEQRQADPLMMVHMSSQVNIPMLSFTHTILDGEQFRSGELGADYLDRLPPAAFRAEFLGRNWGPIEFFLPELREPDLEVGTANLAPYLFLHDVQPWPIWSELAQWEQIYNALDQAGWVEAQFHPYWDAPPATAPDGVLVSAYEADTEAVLAVMNTGDAVDAEITVDLQALGLARIVGAMDIGRDEAFAVEGATITVPLERRQGRIILISEEAAG